MDFKLKIKTLIEAYQTSSLKTLVEDKIISCSAKMIYRSLHLGIEKALSAFSALRLKYDGEPDSEKKELKKIGLKLGSACLKDMGATLTEASRILAADLD